MVIWLMQKEEIVARFMSKGHLLTPDALRCLETKDAGKYIEKKYTNLIINEMDIHDSIYEAMGKEEKIRIIKNLTKKRKDEKYHRFTHSKEFRFYKQNKPFGHITHNRHNKGRKRKNYGSRGHDRFYKY